VSLPLMLSTGAFNRRQLWPHLCASDSEFNKKRERVFASRRSKIKGMRKSTASARRNQLIGEPS